MKHSPVYSIFLEIEWLLRCSCQLRPTFLAWVQHRRYLLRAILLVCQAAQTVQIVACKETKTDYEAL